MAHRVGSSDRCGGRTSEGNRARRRRSASRARTRSGCAALGAASHARAAELRLGPVKRHAMSAIFNFEALLLVLLLMICTATYLKDQPLVGPKMEANKFGCVAATSLLLCSNRVAHEPLGDLSNSKSDRGPGCAPAGCCRCSVQDSSVTWNSLWKLSRIGVSLAAPCRLRVRRCYR